ncbi:hypothetical protein LTR37_007965 [Vermiconidia calcicola]|uniref:Uncharacterized protein n=1 Tax=Vermiconidia calcicola TaxID=1690605 RepID=A0ACC3NDP7_9PEZI|nr:hypothetical protein LTR37_007965 [Vermiconidia calcicola]
MGIPSEGKGSKSKTTDETHSITAASLLRIPGELRNRIYRLAVVEQNTINFCMKHNFLPPEPALLSASKKIRREAADIYYKENSFVLVVHDNDGTIVEKWLQSSKNRKRCNLQYNIRKSTNWKNLHTWLEGFYHGRTDGTAPGKRLDGAQSVNANLFEVVRNLKKQGLAWDAVAACLENMHGMLVAVDAGWA